MMRVAALWVVLLWSLSPAWAQETTPEEADSASVQAEVTLEDTPQDEAEWTALAARAEAAVQAGEASNSAFASLRSDLSEWRDIFLSDQSQNAARIATVQAQIETLGAAPEEGDSDPRVAARRDALNAQLAQLQAPATLAAEAYTQANGLIGEIDGIIRDRQAAEFLERGTSPLNPTSWGDTWDALSSGVTGVSSEIRQATANPSRQSTLISNLPAILVLLAIAVMAVVRGRRWMGHLASSVSARTERARSVVAFVLSLGQVVIPLLGLIALSSAVSLSGMAGRRLEGIVSALPVVGLYPILSHWLAGVLLPKNYEGDVHPLGLDQSVANTANRRLIFLGYALFALGLAQVISTTSGFDTVPSAVWLFPFGIVVAWGLYRFGHVMRPMISTTEDGAPRSFRYALRGLFSRGLLIAAIVGAVFAALGYSNAIELVTLPAAMTVYLLGILVVLQKFSVDLYSLVSRNEEAAKTALLPVLIAFGLILLALPVLALIWGAQTTDLTELWAQFREGFSFGETQISPSNFLLFAVVFVIGYTVTRLVQGALRSTVLPRTRMDAGGQNAIVAGTGYLGIFIAAIVAITMAGIDLSGLAIVAGALSVGIGFGMQNIVSNFVSGIILLIERPISQGDWIEVGGQMGFVRDISVRSTRIETFDRTDLIVPNADLVSGNVTNYTRGNSVGRVIMKVGVAYGTDTRTVEAILREIAEAQPMVLMNPPPTIIFAGFGDSSLDFEIRVLLRDITFYWVVFTEINHQITERFAKEGIEIPFPQQDLWLRNPEVIREGGVEAVPPVPKGDGV